MADAASWTVGVTGVTGKTGRLVAERAAPAAGRCGP